MAGLQFDEGRMTIDSEGSRKDGRPSWQKMLKLRLALLRQVRMDKNGVNVSVCRSSVAYSKNC